MIMVPACTTIIVKACTTIIVPAYTTIQYGRAQNFIGGLVDICICADVANKQSVNSFFNPALFLHKFKQSLKDIKGNRSENP